MKTNDSEWQKVIQQVIQLMKTCSFKTAIYGTFVRRMRKDVRYCFDKKVMKSTVVEIRIAFLICYLQSLYEIELGHYFCLEFVGHVTNQNILVDKGKLM